MNNDWLNAAAARWLARDPWEKTRHDVQQWLDAGDHAALQHAFGTRLRFGTAGLRATVGAGPAQFNALVVRESAAGVARVLQAEGRGGATVAVGFDGRLDSADLAMHAAGTLLAAGFDVALFARPTPTPVVGFWVRRAGLCAGIVITASHNPAADNGLKLYWHTGAQIAPPVDAVIARAIDEVAAMDTPVPWISPGSEEARDHVSDPTQEAIEGYLSELNAQPALRTAREQATAPIVVAYTPLHGVGTELALRALKTGPVQAVHVVASQRDADGYFPTLASPNPEHPNAMAHVHALAREVGAHIACANDPDADRLAVMARQPDGELHALHGDDVGALLADWMLHLARLRNETRPLWTATSTVSSQLMATIARAHAAQAQITLPGFKWLAQAAQTAQQSGAVFVLAYEEALGYAPGPLVWDKDGISSLLYVVQLAAELHAQGETLWTRLAALHGAHGLNLTRQTTVATGGDGAMRWMEALRAHPPKLGEPFRVEATFDGRDPAQSFGLPPSNSLTWACIANEASAQPPVRLRVSVRPSGTEPKLKAYYEYIAPPVSANAYWPRRAQALQELATVMQRHRAWMLELAGG